MGLVVDATQVNCICDPTPSFHRLAGALLV